MGIAVIDHSTAELTDLTARRNRQGIDVFNASLAILRGRIVITDNRSLARTWVGDPPWRFAERTFMRATMKSALGAGNGQLVVYVSRPHRGAPSS